MNATEFSMISTDRVGVALVWELDICACNILIRFVLISVCCMFFIAIAFKLVSC